MRQTHTNHEHSHISEKIKPNLKGLLPVLLVAILLFLPPDSLHAYVLGDNLDEVLVFDSKGDDKGFDQGLVRQRLGLLDANGKPLVDGAGALKPLVSADGTKKGYDMNGGKGTKLKDAAENLKGNGATLTLITHGLTGKIEVDGVTRPGFGTGTGKKDECTLPPPSQLNGIGAKTNLTVNLVVCYGSETEAGVTDVSGSLTGEIASLGGSVTTIRHDADDCPVRVSKSWIGSGLTPEEKQAADNALSNCIVGNRAFKNQYAALQTALDNAVGEGKVTATLHYSADIGGDEIDTPSLLLTDGAVVDEVSYPCNPVCSVNTIPTLNEWGILILALLFMITGLIAIRRHRSTTTAA